MKKELDKRISVIVPIYNTEQYLRRCIDSIINQTYSNLEIILVNDGSTDSSLSIMEEYRKRDNRIHTITQENRGVSEARNAGIKISAGDYVAFVDSDDYILENMYEEMLENAQEHKADICVCFWEFENYKGEKVIDVEKVNNSLFGEMSCRRFAHYMYAGSYENGVVVSATNKLYKSDIWKKYKFSKQIFEDDEVHNKILSQNYSVCVVNKLLYCYTENKKSLTHTLNIEKLVSFLDVLKERVEAFENDEFITRKTMELFMNLYMEYGNRTDKEERKLIRIYKREFYIYLKALRKNNITDSKLIVRSFIIGASPIIYGKLLDLKRKRR